MISKQGLPEYFDKAEENAAHKAYTEACRSGDQKRIAEVLKAYPPLAGRDWKQYQTEST